MNKRKDNEVHNKIRRNFILFGGFSIFAVILSLQFVTGLFTVDQTNVLFTDILYSIVENGGVPPTDLPVTSNIEVETYIEKGFEGNSFSVIVQSNGELQLISDSVSNEFSDIYEDLTLKVLDNKKDVGIIDDYHYVVGNYDGNTIIAFGDFWQEKLLESIFTRNFTLSSVVSMMLLLTLLLWFSGRIIQPITQNIDKQKTFISDAGHELKTPLAIISANAEMLQLEIDKGNIYLENIQNQTIRMTNLIENLLLLSSTHEKQQTNYEKENLSKIVSDVAQTFEVMAANKGCAIELSIKPDILFICDFQKIQEMTVILIDNAVKYSMDHTSIYIELNRVNNKTVFIVKNDIALDSDISTERLFDRFYRADTSRSRESGGYGLGLSIAKSIATLHNGTIKVETALSTTNKTITFTTTLN